MVLYTGTGYVVLWGEGTPFSVWGAEVNLLGTVSKSKRRLLGDDVTWHVPLAALLEAPSGLYLGLGRFSDDSSVITMEARCLPWQ